MIWVGDKTPPTYFWDNLNKWMDLMPHWTYMVWTNEKLEESSDIDPDFKGLLKSCRNGAQAADLLSYYVIEKWGGYLLDADITPLRSLDELDTEGMSVVLCHDLPIDWEYIATGFFGAVPNHQLFKNLVESSYHIDLNDPEQQLTTGPGAMGREWASLNWDTNGGYLMLPYWAFYRNRIGDPDIDSVNRIMRDEPTAFGNHFYAKEWN
jgi:mannosyltransferase OCH1-like enzyme